MAWTTTLMEKSLTTHISRRRLEGKVAIITGGAQGIGEATARLFCQHGAKVVIADIQDDLGRAVCESIDSQDAAYVHCDVTVEDDVRAAVDLAVAMFGRLDIMFNNAGISEPRTPRITDVDTADFERSLRVNATGVFLGTKHAARVMVPAGRGGSIINNGSACTVLGGLAPHGYSASKHAVVGFTKSAAAELGQHGIRVNCISAFMMASALATGYHGRDGKAIEEWVSGVANLKGTTLTAEDVAQAAVYLASEESKYVSALNLVVDGGFTTVSHVFEVFRQA